MPADEELNTLREEWRARLALDIAALKNTTQKIQEDVHEIREVFAKSEFVNKLDERVRSLEESRSRLLGMFVASQIIGGIIVAIIGYFVERSHP